MPVILEVIGFIVLLFLIALGLYRWLTAYFKIPTDKDK